MRFIYEIREFKKTSVWYFYNPDNVCLFYHEDKDVVIKYAEQWLLYLWDFCEELSELRIKTADGVIEDTRTYGLDPEEIRG